MASRKLIVEVVGDTRNLEKNLGKATKTTKGFEVGLKSLAKAAAGVFAARELVKGIEDVVGAAEDAQVSQARLAASFKATGLSVTAYSRQIEAARESGRRLGFTNTETNQSLGSLTTSTGNVAKSMKELGISQDLARFKGVSLETATRALTMANAGSMRAIKQLGITIIPVTNAVDALKLAHKGVKGAIDAHSLSAAKLIDKQATIAKVMDVVQGKVRGQADAYSKTAAGAMARFNAALDDIKERIGAKVLPVMTRWINYLVDHLPQIERFMKNVADKVNTVAQALGGWKPVLEGLAALWILKFTGMGKSIAALMGTGGVGGTGVLGLRSNLAGLARLGAAGIAIPVWINIGTHFLGSSTKSLVEKLLQYGLPQFIPVTILAKGVQAVGGALGGGTMSPGAAKAQFIKEAMASGMTRKEAEAAYNQRSGAAATRAGVASGGGKAGSKRGYGGAGSVGAPPAVINYAGKHRTDSRGGHGVTPKEGFDCSGYLVASYRAAGIQIPHNTVAMYNLGDGQPVPGGYTVHVDPSNVLPGDAVLWDNGQGGAQPGHVGIYAGGGYCWAYSEGSGAPSKQVNMGYLKIMGIRRWVKVRSQVSSGGAGPGGTGTTSQGKTGDPTYGGGGGGGGGGGRRGAPGKVVGHGPFGKIGTGVRGAAVGKAPSPFGAIGGQIAADVRGATVVVGSSLDRMRAMIAARALAIKQAIEKARADVVSSFQAFSSNALSAFDAVTSAWKSPASQALAKMQAEDAMKSAVDAYAAAVKEFGADSPEAQAAARALEEAKLEAQAKAEEEAHAAKVKADRDALEKQLAALEKEAQGAKTKAAAARIRKKINDLLAQYGITPDTVAAATDWQTAQTLFVSSLGNLIKSIDNLTSAITGQSSGGASGPPTSGGLGDRGTDKSAGPPPSPGAGRGGHPPKEDEWWKPYAAGGPVPIIAHGGEYVLRASATRKIGVGNLNYMNRTGNMPRFLLGGEVGGGKYKDPHQYDHLDPPPGLIRQGPYIYTGDGWGDGVSVPLHRNIRGWLKSWEGRGIAPAQSDNIGDWWWPNFPKVMKGYQNGGIVDPATGVPWELPLSSAVGSGPAYEIWRQQRKVAKYNKRVARVMASRALYNPSILPTPASRADSVIDDWMTALSTDALFTERLGALKSFVDSGDAYRGGAVSRSWLTYGVPKLANGGYITRGGIAEVHRGETVTPAGRGNVIHVYVGEKEVAAIVRDAIVEDGRRGGPLAARTP